MSDPYFNTVAMLCHFDGTGVGFTDSSSYANTIQAAYGTYLAGTNPTLQGNTVNFDYQSTNEAAFGTGSLAQEFGPVAGQTYDAYSGIWVAATPGSPLDLTALSAWTFEFFYYPTTDILPVGAYYDYLFQYYEDGVMSSSGPFGYFQISASGLSFLGQNGLPDLGSVSNNINNSQWNHIALVFASGTLSLYANGTLIESAAVGTINPLAYNAHISSSAQFAGASGGSKVTFSYVDEWRISQMARYSGPTYTVPTQQFWDPSQVPSVDVFCRFVSGSVTGSHTSGSQAGDPAVDGNANGPRVFPVNVAGNLGAAFPRVYRPYHDQTIRVPQ